MIDYNLLDALKRINWSHGCGSIKSYRLEEGDSYNGRGVAVRRIPTSQHGGFEETRQFRVVRGTVHFLGHQKKST